MTISVVPANQASWEDLQAVFGTRGAAAWCQCQRYKLRPREAFRKFPVEERARRLRSQTAGETTSGLLTRVGYRKRGVSRALARAAVEFARERGARALEAYPITTKDVITEELHVGTEGVFAQAGLATVSRPTPRRVVMRIDF